MYLHLILLKPTSSGLAYTELLFKSRTLASSGVLVSVCVYVHKRLIISPLCKFSEPAGSHRPMGNISTFET